MVEQLPTGDFVVLEDSVRPSGMVSTRQRVIRRGTDEWEQMRAWLEGTGDLEAREIVELSEHELDHFIEERALDRAESMLTDALPSLVDAVLEVAADGRAAALDAARAEAKRFIPPWPPHNPR